MKRLIAFLSIYTLLVALACIQTSVSASQVVNAPDKTVAILGIPEETEALASRLTNTKTIQVEGLSFTQGQLGGKNVVLGRTGFGKVNAASAATLVIHHFRPEGVIFTGTAGGLNPDFIQGDVVIGANVAHHDFGRIEPKSNENPTGFSPWQTRSPITGIQNPLFFPADERLRTAALKAAQTVKLIPAEGGTQVRPPKVFEAVVVTGDSFISDRAKSQELNKQFEADAVEMEGAAVAQVCWQFKVPCLIIRSISDRADGSAYLDYEKFLKVAAENSSKLVEQTLAVLDDADPSPSPGAQQWKCAFELAFGENSPYSQKFPNLYDFPYEDNLEITKEVLDKIVEIALNETGLKRIELAYLPGGYNNFPVVPSAQLAVEGTEASVDDALTIIGYLAQQTAVIGSARIKPGSRPAVEIIQTSGQQLGDSKTVEDFFHRLSKLNPKLGIGFSSIMVDGQPGIYIIDPEGRWIFKDYPKFNRAIMDASKALGISTSMKSLPVEYTELRNEWKLSPKGEQYLDRLTRKGLVPLRDKLVNVYQPEVEKWIADAFGKHAPRAAIRPFAERLRPQRTVRQRLYTRRPPVQKQSRQDYINRP